MGRSLERGTLLHAALEQAHDRARREQRPMVVYEDIHVLRMYVRPATDPVPADTMSVEGIQPPSTKDTREHYHMDNHRNRNAETWTVYQNSGTCGRSIIADDMSEENARIVVRILRAQDPDTTPRAHGPEDEPS